MGSRYSPEIVRQAVKLRREQAREDLYVFAKHMFWHRRRFLWLEALHHRLICDSLMRVYRGECKRLIINIPPRYSKTELAVINFIAWAMGNVPDSEFIHVSYSSRLATNNSFQAKQIVEHPEYQEVFPGVQIDHKSNAKDDWRTTKSGVMYATSMGGAITGYGAGKHRPGFGGAIIIDDPHKADEARSDVMRQNVIEWFKDTLESRVNSPDTPIILIMQRLHEDDLSGWLLGDRKDGVPIAGGNGEVWEHLCLSAIQHDEHGNEVALWPEKHTLDALRTMEKAKPYSFAGQYQQRPAPLDGGIFRPDQIKVVDAIPAGRIHWARGWDFASLSADGDFTAGGKLGQLEDGRYIIGDMVRGQWAPDERDAAIVNTGSQDGRSVRISIPQDPGQAGKTQVTYLTRQLSGHRVHTSPESGDKVTRAEPFAAQINVGNVMMLRGPWNDALINEMRMFPNGTYDDQIDSLSRAFGCLLERRHSYFG